MGKREPVYYFSSDEALKMGEIDKYRDSNHLNEDCAQTIKDTINNNFDGYRLNHHTSDAVVQEFGLERVKLVLANTIRIFKHDGRITGSNKEWAQSIPLPGSEQDRRYYLIDGLSGLLDMWTTEVRQREAELIQVADQAIEVGRNETTSGNYFVSFEEAGKGILDTTLVADFKDDIVSLMYGSDAVSDIELSDEGEFDVNFCLSYTPNYEPWQEEIDEHGEGWPKQEPLVTLAQIMRGNSAPSASLVRQAAEDVEKKPSVLGQLRENQEEIKSTPSTTDAAHSKSNDLEV